MVLLTECDRQILLAVARGALRARVLGGPWPAVDAGGVLATPAAAFVTLRVDGRLCGCIGHPESQRALLAVVAACAEAACSEDPRFPPLSPHDLARVQIEISVLGPLELVARPDQIEIGRHGVVLEQGPRRGLLLPQVAVEWGWDPQRLVAHACLKAGIASDAWKHGARIFRFEADVFGDFSLRAGGAAL